MSEHPDDSSNRWLQALTDGAREIVALVDRDGRPRFVSHATADILGVPPNELAVAAASALVHEDDLAAARDAFFALVQQGGRQTTSVRVRHRMGHFLRVEVTATNYLGDPAIAAVVVHARPARAPTSTHSRRVETRLVFNERVKVAIEEAKHDPSRAFAVMVVEIEQYKRLLGTYGEDVADRVSRQVWDGITQVLGPEDQLCHLGGGEFALLLPEVATRQQARRAADATRSAAEVRVDLDDGETIATSASVGVATSERGYARADELVRDATAAMNRSRGAKGPTVFQTQMRVEDTRYLALATGMRGAIERDEFRVFFQPIVALESRVLTGFEALVRWQHPTRGIISPVDFIPVAEETGLIWELGAWVLERACQVVQRWNHGGEEKRALSVSVNISPVQLSQGDLVALVRGVLGHTGLPPRLLKLEVTESAVLDRDVDAKGIFHKLSELGVKLSLDDFGTGYSSFSYLHQLPYDTLKIDRSFIRRIDKDSEHLAVVQAIVTLAHNLGLEVVAEGIETDGQERTLTGLRCEMGQGYLYSPPISEDDTESFLASKRTF